MRTIFTKAKELEAQVVELSTDLEAATNLHKELEAKNQTLNARIVELEAKANGVPQAEFETLKTEKETLAKQVVELQANLEVATKKATDVETQASMKAQEILANAGSPQIQVVLSDHPANMESQKAASRFVVTNM